ncbi:MAG: alanine dehydrogenase [Gammaproteobacteria bacterium]
MHIGCAKEIKDKENRVAITPDGAGTLVAAGHEVCIETLAGSGSGFSDEDYRSRGATIGTAEEAWGCDLVVKIKEPLPVEYPLLQGQILFTYLHLAGVDPTLTHALLESGTTGIAYETVEDSKGGLPLLAPMSAVAGTMSALVGAWYLAKFNDGRGMLTGRVMGEPFGRVLVIGDGVVGKHAAAAAAGLGANATIATRHLDREVSLKKAIGENVEVVLSSPATFKQRLPETDLLIGGVLLRGARAPHVVDREMVESMPNGSVLVDVSIDQGGCIETARPTSHSDPVFVEAGVTHYCVTNMPGAYPRTSTIALTRATLPYVLRLAGEGMDAVRADPGLAKGVNTYEGKITCRAVSDALDLEPRYQDFESTL